MLWGELATPHLGNMVEIIIKCYLGGVGLFLSIYLMWGPQTTSIIHKCPMGYRGITMPTCPKMIVITINIRLPHCVTDINEIAQSQSANTELTHAQCYVIIPWPGVPLVLGK